MCGNYKMNHITIVLRMSCEKHVSFQNSGASLTLTTPRKSRTVCQKMYQIHEESFENQKHKISDASDKTEDSGQFSVLSLASEILCF